MPNDPDLRALLEALEAWESRLTQPQSAAVAALNAMPAIRKLLRGEFGPLPLRCESPEIIDYDDGCIEGAPCGTCEPCRINASVEKKS